MRSPGCRARSSARRLHYGASAGAGRTLTSLSKFTRHDVIVDHSRETGGGAMALGLPLGIDLSCVCVYVCTCVCNNFYISDVRR